MTFIRGIHWLAMVITGWSLSLRWGDEIAAGKGPPSQWERHVVGATLLLGIAALAMMLTARGKSNKTVAAPGSLALAISALSAMAACGVALSVRQAAISGGLAHALLGGGWMWMLSGTAIGIGAVLAALLVRVQSKSPPVKASKTAKGK